MRGRYKQKNLKGGSQKTTPVGAGFSPLPEETAAGSGEPGTPVPGVTVQDMGSSKKGTNVFRILWGDVTYYKSLLHILFDGLKKELASCMLYKI